MTTILIIGKAERSGDQETERDVQAPSLSGVAGVWFAAAVNGVVGCIGVFDSCYFKYRRVHGLGIR